MIVAAAPDPSSACAAAIMTSASSTCVQRRGPRTAVDLVFRRARVLDRHRTKGNNLVAILVEDDELVRIVAQLAGVDDRFILPSTALSELVVDSFSLVQLAMDVQEEFEVIFYADDLADLATVGDLIALIRARA